MYCHRSRASHGKVISALDAYVTAYASWLLEGNEARGIKPAEMLDVRDWMGHASVQETEGYVHRSRASSARAVNNLDAHVR